MEAFTRLSGPLLALPRENVDTDQIVPARFLTSIDFERLGEALFADWRFDADGRERPGCVFNEPRARRSPVLVAGRNFGCGSSREHAPRALLEFGFRVVISSEIADIFRNNSLNIGLLPISLPPGQHQRLLEMDAAEITVDLERCIIEAPGDIRFPFEVDAFARYCLLNGMNRLDYLLAAEPAIKRYEVSHEP